MSRLRVALWRVLGALCLALTLVGPVHAQVTTQQREAYQEWLETAARAEAAIDARRASNAALEALRREIVEYRQNFLSLRDQNSDRIATLQSQLNALGPAPDPDTGGPEPEDIAVLRADLTAQLTQLRVPTVVSQEAFNRANGLISEIDQIIRQRQARQLLERSRSPLLPSVWTEALRETTRAVRDLVNETQTNLQRAAERQQLRNLAPSILLIAAVGLVFLGFGRGWAGKLGDVMRRIGGRGTGIWSFLVSLGRIVLPLFGLLLLSVAIQMSGIVGLRGEAVLAAIPAWGALLLGFRWLGERIYSKRDEDALVPLPPPRRGQARLAVLLMAVVLVLYDMVGVLEQIETLSPDARAAVGFPVIVAAALVLLQLRQAALPGGQRNAPEADEALKAAGMQRIAPVLRRLSVIVAVISPLAAAAGFGALAEALIYPTIQTIALFGLVLVLQRFIKDLYAWISRKGDAARDSLVPALLSLMLVLLSLPPLALIWGARVADLTELWTNFLEGFTVGETQISPTDFLAFAVIFAIGYGATRLLQSALGNSLLPKTNIDPGGQNAIVSGTGYVGIFLAALIAITSAGIDLSSIAIVAGALSVGIGFGLQTIVSNFVSGIILLIERPISEGDWIEVGGQMGYVRDISVRATRIETFDRTDVIVPNADLVSGAVTNYTRGNTVGRVIAPVGVAYGTDTRRVETILSEIANAHPMVLAVPPPTIVFQGFGADSLDFEIRALLRDVNWVLSVRSDMNHEIARRFAEEGIEIPFAQRDVWLRNPEALAAGPSSSGAVAPPEARQAVPGAPDAPDGNDGDST